MYPRGVIAMMNRKFLLVIATAVVCFVIANAADATGKWTTTINTQIGDMPYTYDFKVDGEKLTGKAKSQFGDVEITEGKCKDDEITFVENVSLDGNAIRIDYKGKVSGDEIKFTRQVGQFATEEFVAKRVK
jgi:hypothetical protein